MSRDSHGRFKRGPDRQRHVFTRSERRYGYLVAALRLGAVLDWDERWGWWLVLCGRSLWLYRRVRRWFRARDRAEDAARARRVRLSPVASGP